MAQPLIEAESHPTNTFAQWFGVLGGPIAWAMQLQANYALVPQACAAGDLKWIHLTSAALLLLAISAVVIAWRDWIVTRRKVATREEAEARSSFMALLGVFTSGLFALLIFAQAIPTFIFNPCEK
jgi:hypothetical protein